LSKHRSASKIEPAVDPKKTKILEERKKLMEKKVMKVKHDKKEARRLKEVLEQLKKQKKDA
jgi:uncharacterized FlgJ-related protein